MPHVKTAEGYDVKVPSQGQVNLNMVNAMVEQANMKGHINIFGVEVGRNAFEDLKRMVENM